MSERKKSRVLDGKARGKQNIGSLDEEERYIGHEGLLAQKRERKKKRGQL